MIYLFDKDEKLIKIVRKSAVKTALQKYALTTGRYVSDRLTVELKGLNADELEQVEYMAIQTMEDAHTFHYFYVAQKFFDKLTTLIGVQSGIEELRKSPIFDKRPKNAFARDVITDLLAGTNWQARFVGETAPHSTNFYYTSVFDALKKVCVVWDLEMQFFVEMNGNRIGARYIDFKQKIGQAVGKRVVYGHNALQILQEVERTNIFTALVGRGKGEETGDGYGRKITFENVVWSRTQGKPVDKPKGQKYLELPLMTRQYGIKNADGSMRPKIGFVDFSEEENPEVLIERTYKALIDAARPQLTLKTSSVYLRGVKVGDTIRVVRHDKKLDYDTRVFEITFNRLNNQSSDIKLGDRIGESNEAKVQTIADKAVERFVNNEFSNFVQNLPDYLPSADGFNNNWYGTEDPTVKYLGKVLINDIWYKPDPEHEGHKIMLRWTGEVWEEILRTYEGEALREKVEQQLAESDRLYQQAQQAQDRQIAESLRIAGTSTNLANAARALAEQANNDLVQVKASAESQARLILEQAQCQSELINRVTTVENVVDGTKVTVTELSKTLNKATGDIDSVTSRTKTVEDNLSQTRAQYEHLIQTVNAQTGQIDSINRKTVDLQSGIDGVTQRFENLQIGGNNLLKNTKDFSGEWDYNGQRRKIAPWKYNGLSAIEADYPWEGLTQLIQVRAGEVYTFSAYVASSLASDSAEIYIHLNNYRTEQMSVVDNYYRKFNMTANFQRVSITFKVITDGYIAPRIERSDLNGILYFAGMKLERGTIATDWSPSLEDATNYADAKIAEYKNTVDGRFAAIQSSVDNKANLVDFQRVQETARLYERILGASENEVNSNLARQVLTSSLWQTEITRLPRAGGKNYFLNSNFKEGLQFWENNTSSPDLSIDPQLASQVKRVGALHVDTGNTGAFAHGFYQIVDIPVSANEQVTVSFDVAGFSNNDAGLIIIINNHLFDVRKEIPAAEIPKASSFGPTSLKRKSVTLTIPQDCDRICCIIIFGPGTVGNMVFADMQIEKGGAASDHRLNPTDANRELEAVTTRVTQLAGSWAVQNLTSAGTVLNQINLLANGTNRIDGRLTHITGQTLIDNGVINNAMIGNLDAGKITTGFIESARIATNSIDGSKLVFDQAFFNKLMANDAYLKQLFAQSAFITSVQAVAVSAKQIVGGIAKALNGGMDVNFDESKINFYTNVAAIRRIYTGHPTQFIKFETEGNYSRTIIGSNRNGGEVFNSATFAGLVVENTNNINTEDNVRLYGDNTLFRHAQGDVGWNINSVTQRIVPANINAESEIWSKHFVAPDKNSKPVRLDTAVAALWDIWNHIIYNNFEFNEALRTHIKARRDNWKFELNL
ncbi:phage tail spike protein [Streptococcus suis]|uniref:phage tail spike protein n=3 Tax=Streptococcus suis TaxID=1307 RepID=UPI00192D4FEA|nr:phage tail spike protein [Streptococcus suis]HEM6576400.1 phage tail protein [Streptococcus suis]